MANISVNMTKARGIKREQIREERNKKLAALDVDFMRAVEDDDTDAKASIATKKQALRDAPSDPAIDAAATPTELKAVRPAALDAD